MSLPIPVAVAATIAALLCWPFFLLIGIVNELGRLVVQIVLWLEGNGVSLSPNGSDNIFHCHQTYSGKHILALFYTEGVANLEDERQRFATCLENHGNGIYAKLTKIIVRKYGYAALKSVSDFDVSNHVVYYGGHCPKNGIVYTEEEIKDHIVPSLFMDMDESKPQWEWVILPFQVQREESGSLESLRFLRMHHSFMDGIGCLMLLGDNITEWGSEGKASYLVSPRQPLPLKLRILRIWAEWINPVVFFVCLFKALFASRHPNLGPFAVPSGEYRKNIFAYSERLDVASVRPIKDLKRVSNSAIFATALQKPLATLLANRGVSLGSAHSKVLINHALLPYGNGDYTTNRVTNSTIDLNLVPPKEGRINWIGHHLDPLFFAAFLHVRFVGRLPIRFIRPLLVVGEAGVQFGNFPISGASTISGNKITDGIIFAMNGAPIGLGCLAVGYGTHFRLCSFTTEECMSKRELSTFLVDYAQEIRNMASFATEENMMHRKYSCGTKV